MDIALKILGIILIGYSLFTLGISLFAGLMGDIVVRFFGGMIPKETLWKKVLPILLQFLLLAIGIYLVW